LLRQKQKDKPLEPIEGPDQPSRAVADAALAWLEVDSVPRAIIDADNLLVWANERATVLLADRQGLEVRDGVLTASEASRQSDLRATVAAGVSAPSSWCFRTPIDDGWIIVRAQNIAPPGQALVGLSFVVAHTRHRARYEHLDSAFGLTPTEHRVLMDLLDGNDAEKLAAKHRVTIETTRSHIRSIYSKLEVNSREQLFARVQAFKA
jgi:DNA-binding CsgD family transcriptional regulator